MRNFDDEPTLDSMDQRYFYPLPLQSGAMDTDGTIGAATLIGQNPQDVNRILADASRQYENYYDELQRYGIQRVITRWIFITIITYVLRNGGTPRNPSNAELLGFLKICGEI